METIRGKMSLDVNSNELNERLANYKRIVLDLGTGDGRYVHFLAERFPDQFIIGVDSCRENLHARSRANLPNTLFVIASAQNLPRELSGLASQVTINFPWGSLLESLLNTDEMLMPGLASIVDAHTRLEIRLNGGALSEAGWHLEAGAEQIRAQMLRAGWQVNEPVRMDTAALRAFPSTWAKRIAFGRDPRALLLSGCIR